MNVTFAHICDYASISREGKLSAMGIFDRINVAAIPATHHLLYLAYEIGLHAAEFNRPFRIKIVLVDADGNVIFETEGQGVAKGTGPVGELAKVPQLVAIGGVPLPRAGKYSIDIFLNGDHKQAAPFEVAMMPASQEAPPVPELPA